MPEGWENGKRFATIYDAHRVALVAYCRRRLPRDVVDDVIAEVFLTAWRRIGELPHGSELPWLYGVARNVVANQRRSVVRRSRLWDRVVSRRTDIAIDMTVERMDGDQTVVHALATLSELDQEVLRLRAWEELTSAEIGLVLGISASAVDMRLSRARRRLEQALSSAGSTSFGSGARLAKEGSS